MIDCMKDCKWNACNGGCKHFQVKYDNLQAEMEDKDGCISGTLILLADYDGYNDVVGLKKLIDQARDLLESDKPMEFHTEKEWDTIKTQAAEIGDLNA